MLEELSGIKISFGIVAFSASIKDHDNMIFHLQLTCVDSQSSYSITTGLALDLLLKGYVAAQCAVVVLKARTTGYKFADGLILIYEPQMMVLLPRAEGVMQFLRILRENSVTSNSEDTSRAGKYSRARVLDQALTETYSQFEIAKRLGLLPTPSSECD